jgi:hypothetical protein
VIFPFAACWRHYVELQLKSLIEQCQKLLDQTAKRRGGHNIEQLWSEMRPLLVQLHPQEERLAMLGVVNWFEDVDTQLDHDEDSKIQALEYEWEIRQEYEQEMRDMYGEYDNY